MHDLARSQRIGAWAWTVFLVLTNVAYLSSYVAGTATADAACAQNRDQVLAI